MSGRLTFLCLALCLGCRLAYAQDLLTANGDNYRTNSVLTEGILNTSNVNATQFGKLFTLPVDGQVYAQPLYLRGYTIPEVGTFNILYVATMHNSVYAFDADATQGKDPLWQVNLGSSVDPLTITNPIAGPFGDIQHEIGILSTPVIDRSLGAIYVVSETLLNGKMTFYMHALDLANGAEIMNGPVEIQATVEGSGWGGSSDPTNGQLPFFPDEHIQRPGLLEANGNIYAGFGSHGDYPPWHGWVMGYVATNLQQQVGVFNTTPNSAGGAVWQAGRGLAADPNGDIYLVSGNGVYDGQTAWSNSVLHLSPTLSVVDWFTPSQFQEWTSEDVDFGSNGPILVAGSNQIIAGGKGGIVALADSTTLGHEDALNSQAQVFQATPDNQFAIFNSALWNRPDGAILYLWGNGDSLKAFQMQNGQFNTTPIASNPVVANTMPFYGMTVSSNNFVPGSGILWLTTQLGGAFPTPGTLHAIDASDITRELWNSGLDSKRDAMGNFTKFANPTVANGRVYVPTDSKQIAVYGLLNVPGVTAVVNGASFAGGLVAPGELISIFGNKLGPPTPVPLTLHEGKVATTVAGVTVDFDGAPAPLLYVSANQINAVVPFAVAGQTTIMHVTAADGGVYSVTLPATTSSPAVFTETVSGNGQGAILNANYSVNSTLHPATRGTTVAIYGTGTGILSPAAEDGSVTPLSHAPLSSGAITVTIGGQPAAVSYQGAAPGLVAGVMQINAQVPNNISPGSAVPVVISVNGVASPNNVTMAVQ